MFKLRVPKLTAKPVRSLEPILFVAVLFGLFFPIGSKMGSVNMPVSYTHLDVYKRQEQVQGGGCAVYKKTGGSVCIADDAFGQSRHAVCKQRGG